MRPPPARFMKGRKAWMVKTTDVRLTSSAVDPVRSARAADTLSLVAAETGSASTRSSVPWSLWSSWIVAPARPYWSTALRASATDASPAGTSHTTPPSKSMPRLRPLPISATSPIRTARAPPTR